MKAFLVAPESTVRAALVEALSERHYEVAIAEQAELADHWQPTEDTRLVIQDVDTFTEHALDLCRQWRASPHGPHMVILALTRRDEPAFLQQCLRAGVDDYLLASDDAERLAVRLTVAQRLFEQRSRHLTERQGNDEKLVIQQLLDLQERDRQLLAYELHDGFAQQLTGVHYYLQSFRETLARHPDEAWRLFDMALHTLDNATTEVRRLIQGLRPAALENASVTKAIRELVGEAQRDAGLDVEFVTNLNGDQLTPQLANTVFRVVQESLTNVRRHSHSERVQVRLLRQGDTLHVEVRDWGVGFNPTCVDKGHFGLEGILHRARLLGGKATIQSEVGRGTLIAVDLPLEEAKP